MEAEINREYRLAVHKIALKWQLAIIDHFKRQAPEIDTVIIREFVRRNPAAFVIGSSVDPDYMAKCIAELKEQYG